MRSLHRFWAAAAIALLGLVGAAGAREPASKTKPATCGEYGTNVHFEANPSDAAKRALKEEKLVMVLHISGHFEDPDFTWNNAEALRVGALASPKVGEYVEKYFVSAYQRVGTFRIVGKAKQGGNVATYFCAPDGRVLHAIAGPVGADEFVKEASWVVETAKKAIEDSKGNGAEFKAIMRKAHAAKLRTEHGLAVEAVTFDPPDEDDMGALSYRDPTGRPLAPKLTPAPIEGPDVKFALAREASAKSAGAAMMLDRRGGGWAINNQGRVHVLLAAHSMGQIEKLYGSVFEGILGERISTRPVEVVGNPFPKAPKAALR